MSLLAETMEEHVHSDNPSKNTINTCFNRHETPQMFNGVRISLHFFVHSASFMFVKMSVY